MKTKLLLFFFLPLFTFSQTQLGEYIRNPDENHIKPSQFGTGVAISADGSIVAVGGPGNNEDSFVRVYQYQNNEWQQLGEDIINENILEKVGSSVSLSANGKIVAIGAVDGGNLDEGVVRIYKFINDKWEKQGNDIVGDGTQFYLGYKVILSSDGRFLAATAYRTSSSKKGTVKVYENISGTWTQRGTNLEGEATSDAFGISIDLSDDGNVLAVLNRGQKKAQVFKFENNDWTQIGSDFTNLETDITSYEGLGVSLNANGFILSVGSSTGVSIYQNDAGTWNLKGTKIAFGSYSSLSAKGDKIAIGSPENSKIRNYIFENNNWIQRGNDIETWRNSRLGKTVTLSSDGETVIAFPAVYSFNPILLSTKSILSEKLGTLYPNPTHGNFRIQLSNNLVFQEATIFNVLGKKVLTSIQTSIDVSTFSEGIYFVKINTNKGIIYKKIIKK